MDWQQLLYDPIQAPSLSYRQIKDEKDKVMPDASLAEYSQAMNARTGSRAYDQGLDESWIKDAVIGVDRAIESTGLPQVTGGIGGLIGGAFGESEAGYEAGKGVPRMFAAMLPAVAAAPFSEGTSLFTIPSLLGAVGTGSAMAAQTYTDTDSPGAAAVSGVLGTAAPFVGKAASTATGQFLANRAGTMVGETLPQRLAMAGASQAGVGGLFEAAHQGQALGETGSLDLSKRHLVEQLVGQAAFLPLDIPTVLRAPSADAISAHRTQVYEQKTKDALFGYRPRNPGARPEPFDLYAGAVDPRIESLRAKPPVATPESRLPSGDVEPVRLSWNGREVLGLEETRQAADGSTQVLVKQPKGKTSFWVDQDDLAPWQDAGFTLVGEGSITSSGRPQGPQQSRALSIAPEKALALPMRDLMGAKVPVSDPAPLQQQAAMTPQVADAVKAQANGLLKEKDFTRAITSVRKMYDQLAPVYRVHDVTLQNLSDQVLREKLARAVDVYGEDLGDASMRVVQGLKNDLDMAVEAKKRTYGAQNKLVSLDRMNELRAQLAAKRGQTQMSIIGVDPTALPIYLELGVGHAEAMLRAGALKIQDWLDAMRQEAPDLNDAQLQALWRQVNQQLNVGDNIVERRRASAETEQAALRLQAMEDNWRQQTAGMSPEQREMSQNPLVRLNRLREQVFRKNKYLEKYPTAQESMLRAMAQADLGRSDAEIYRFLETTAKNEMRQELRKQTAGQSKLLAEYDNEQQAYEAAEKVNKTIPADANEEVVVEGKKAPFKVVRRAKGVRSLDERQAMREEGTPDFKRQSDEALLRELEGDETRLETSFDEDAPIVLNDEGEVIDTIADIDKDIELASRELGPEVAETMRSEMADVWDKLSQRADPFEFSARGVKEPGVFSQRVKVMLEYFRDARISLSGETDVSTLMKRMQDANVPFADRQQLIAWYSPKGQFFDQVMGPNGWLVRQPEVLRLIAAREGRTYEEAPTPQKQKSLTRQQVLEREINKQAKALEEMGGTGAFGAGKLPSEQVNMVPAEYGTPAVGESFIQSAQYWALKHFRRLGYSNDLANAYANRVARVAGVWAAASQARVTSFENPGTAWGAAITRSMDPSWQGIVALAERAFPVQHGEVWQKGMILGHEGWHIVEQSAARGELTPNERLAFDQVMSMADSMDEGQRTDFLRGAFYNSLPTDLRLKIQDDVIAKSQLQGFLEYSAESPREFVSTLAGLYAMAASEPTRGSKMAKQLLTAGDGRVTRFMNMVFAKAAEFTRALVGMFKGTKLGLIEGKYTADEAIERFHKSFTELSRRPEEIDSAVTELSRLYALSPDKYIETLAQNTVPAFDSKYISGGDSDIQSALEVAHAKILPPDDPNRINDFASYASDVAQLVEAHPKLRPILAESYAYRALAENAAEAIVAPFVERSSVGGAVQIKGPAKELGRLAKSRRAQEAYSDLALHEDAEGRFATDVEKQAIKRKHGLSDQEFMDLQSVRNAFSESMEIASQQIMRFQRSAIEHLVAKTLLADTPGNYKDAISHAQMITQNALGSPVAIDLSRLPISPTALAKAQDIAMSMAPKYKAVEQAVTNRPWHSPEQRFGEYQVSYKQAGETLRGRMSAKTEGEFNQLLARLRARPDVSDVRTFSRDSEFAGMSADVVNAVKDIEKTAYEKSLQHLPRDVAEQVREVYSLGNAVDKELAVRGLGRYSQRRRFAPGRESIDMLQNSIDYMTTLPFGLAKPWLRDRASVVMQDADFQANPQMQSVAKQQFEKMLAASTPLENKVKAATFYYYLGGNLSSALLQLSEPLTQLPAQLTQDGASIGEGYKLIGEAAKKVASAFGKGSTGDSWLDGMIHKLELGRILDKGIVGQFFDEAELNYMNLKRLAHGESKALDVLEATKKPLAWLGAMSRKLFSVASSASTRTSAVAALLRARQQGMTDSQAYDYAVRMVGLTSPGSGGRVTQPIGLGTDGGFLSRSAKSMLTSLQSYNIAVASGTFRTIHDAVKSGQLSSAQGKAAVQLLSTQFLLAGALGLPGVGIALGLANQVMPDLEIKRRMREGLASLGGDDQDLGYFVSNLALRGLPTAVSPVDVSNRMGMSSMLGVSSYDGFNLKDIFGAPGGVAGSMWDATQLAQKGDFARAAERAAPTALRNVMSAWRQQGEVRDNEGNLLYHPDAAERLAMTIGFTPKKLADIREFKRLSQQADTAARNSQDRLLDSVADLIDGQRFGEARQMLIDAERENPTEFNSVEGLKLAIQRAQNRHIQARPTERGGRASSLERSSLAATYGGNVTPQVSEVQRLMQRKQLEQTLGLFSGMNQQELMEAQMVDQVMAQNPRMTLSDARRAVERAMGKRNRTLAN